MFSLQTSFKPLLLKRGGGVKSISRGDFEWQGGKLLRLLSQLRRRIRPLHSLSDLPFQRVVMYIHTRFT
jgi:hypothetical protein